MTRHGKSHSTSERDGTAVHGCVNSPGTRCTFGAQLAHGHALGEVAGLVRVEAAQQGQVVGQHLHRGQGRQRESVALSAHRQVPAYFESAMKTTVRQLPTLEFKYKDSRAVSNTATVPASAEG